MRTEPKASDRTVQYEYVYYTPLIIIYHLFWKKYAFLDFYKKKYMFDNFKDVMTLSVINECAIYRITTDASHFGTYELFYAGFFKYK